MQEEEINQSGFTASFTEWQYMQHDRRNFIQCINELTCAACQPAPHSLHIDANMKLFVYARNREPWRERYHSELFLPSELVVQHIKDIDAAMGKQVTRLFLLLFRIAILLSCLAESNRSLQL